MRNVKLGATLMGLFFYAVAANACGEKKLKTIGYEVTTTVSVEEAWKILDSYGDVGSFHSGIVSSKSLEGSENEASVGCERECTIENGRKDIVVGERIIEYKKGEYYKYDVFYFENFPADKFYNTFGVKINSEGKTVIYVKSEYRLKPAFLSGMMKGKLRKGNNLCCFTN